LDPEVQRVLDEITSLGTEGDPVVRAKRLGELLDRWPDAHAKVREMRQQAVQELSTAGQSYRAIGEQLGISFGRVRQIIDGETASGVKPKSE
jgi:DNA-binding NarL/FixJ family response regulator